MSSNDPKLSKKLETFSLMRMLPPGAADMGDVTRDELRDRDLGTWSAPCGRTDDVAAALVPGPDPARASARPPSSDRDPRLMEDFDEVLPHGERDETAEQGPVIELRFSGS